MATKRQRGEERRKRKRREKLRNQAIAAVVVIAAIAVVVLIVRNVTQNPTGESLESEESVAIMQSVAHFSDGDEIEYNSNPPTSGPHYTSDILAGFYDEDSPEAEDPHPEGYLVHNLEHGYVIIWYNCGVLDDAGCTELKSEIRAVLIEESNKVIAFPWNNMAEPVVLTSWGRMLRMEKFDSETALRFIKINRSHPRAPEPNVN